MRTIGCILAVACAVAMLASIEGGPSDRALAGRVDIAPADAGRAKTSRPDPALPVPSLSNGETTLDAAGAEDEFIHFAGGTIRLDFDPAEFAISRTEIVAWVRASARATAAYFGRFPVPYVRVAIEPAAGHDVIAGRAVGRPEARIVVTMGRRADAATLEAESLLVHEMVHLAVPDVDIRHLWLHEGIATYVENVARAQAGLVPAGVVWGELMRELPAGLPVPREAGGLDGTESDGRRYWGGALFCLIADIEIRKATANRLGLQDALRGLQRQGGNLARMWKLEQILEGADRATGTTVMSSLYKRMGRRPYAPDLDRIWRELGVDMERGRVVFDDAAAQAAIRRAITERPSGPLLVAAPRLLRVIDAAVAVRNRPVGDPEIAASGTGSAPAAP